MASQPLILVVDDEPAGQLRIRLTLERDDYCVLATTRDEALSILRIVSPALILLDVKAGGDGSLALVRALRRVAGSGPVPVLAMTSDSELGARMVAARAGCAGYISKPLDLPCLGSRVAEFIG